MTTTFRDKSFRAARFIKYEAEVDGVYFGHITRLRDREWKYTCLIGKGVASTPLKAQKQLERLAAAMIQVEEKFSH